jgi:SAM-dependent methyltransferase
MPEHAADAHTTALVREGYDRIAEQYTNAATAPGPHPRHDWVAALLARLAPESAVLDIGCGAAVPTGAAIVTAGHRLTGIDVSPRQIELAREHVPAGTFHVADATEVELGPSSFDAVTALFCFTHMPREEHAALFARIHTWLAPDGWFLTCLSTTDQPGWLEEDFLGFGGTSWTNGFDTETNRALLVGAGFALIEAAVVEVDEPSGREAWFWVLARRAVEPSP